MTFDLAAKQAKIAALQRIEDALLTSDQLDQLEPPAELVGKIIPAGSLVVIYGRPGSYKTFLALDWALCVAAGVNWQGWPVKQGGVIYLAAEGVGGLAKRKQAWQDARGVKRLDEALWLPKPVNLLDTQVDAAALTGLVYKRRPALLVVDTMARCLLGGDENSSRDIGLAVDVAGIICGLGATVVLVHHTTKAGDSYRGSSALEGAADVAIEIVAEGATVTVTCTKAKDSAAFETFRLQAVPRIESLVLKELLAGSDDLRAAEAVALDVIGQEFGDIVAGITAWQKATGLTERTFRRVRRSLCDKGLVVNVGTERRPAYKVVPANRPPTGQPACPPSGYRPATHPPLGVADVRLVADTNGSKPETTQLEDLL